MSGITDSYELRERLTKASSAADIYRLAFDWQGKGDGLLAEIARHSPVWDEGLVLLVLQSPIGVSKLLENPLRPSVADRLLARWMVNRLRRGPVLGSSCEEARESLLTLIEQGRLPWSWSETQELLDIARPEEKKFLTTRRELAIDLLLRHPGVPREVLAQLSTLAHDPLKRPRIGADRIARLAAHPNSDQELWRPLMSILGKMDKTLPERMLGFLCGKKGLRLDPEMRPALIKSAISLSAPSILRELVEDAQDDCAYCFRSLASLNLYHAATLLNEADNKIESQLKISDLQEILQSTNQEHRLAAIQALGRIRRSEGNRGPDSDRSPLPAPVQS